MKEGGETIMEKGGGCTQEESAGNQALMLSSYSKKDSRLAFRAQISDQGRLVSGKRRRTSSSLGPGDHEGLKGTGKRAVRYKRKYSGKRKYKSSFISPDKPEFPDLKESDFHLSYLMHTASIKEDKPDTKFNLDSGAPKDAQEQVKAVLSRKVTILILTWNSFNHTKKCLEALKSTLPDSMVEVVVFDNGSTYGTVPYLADQSWLVTVFQMYTAGFAEALNWALAYTDPESDVILLHNDILVQQPNWIELLQETAYSSPEAGIVGSRLLGGSETNNQQFTGIYEVKQVALTCSYWKKELLNQIGPLDMESAFYLGDADYCLKAKKAGFKVLYDGRISPVHFRHVPTEDPEL